MHYVSKHSQNSIFCHKPTYYNNSEVVLLVVASQTLNLLAETNHENCGWWLIIYLHTLSHKRCKQEVHGIHFYQVLFCFTFQTDRNKHRIPGSATGQRNDQALLCCCLHSSQNNPPTTQSNTYALTRHKNHTHHFCDYRH